MIDRCSPYYSKSQALLNQSGTLVLGRDDLQWFGGDDFDDGWSSGKRGVTRSRGEKKSSLRRVLTLLTAGCNCLEIQVFIIIKWRYLTPGWKWPFTAVHWEVWRLSPLGRHGRALLNVVLIVLTSCLVKLLPHTKERDILSLRGSLFWSN